MSRPGVREDLKRRIDGASDPGMKDRDILHLAAAGERIVLTLDKDFRQLSLHTESLGSKYGVILFRCVSNALHAISLTRLSWIREAEYRAGVPCRAPGLSNEVIRQCRATQRVYRTFMTSAKPSSSGPEWLTNVAGKVNSADKLYLVIESVRPDTRHSRSFTVPAPADGAGGSPIG